MEGSEKHAQYRTDILQHPQGGLVTEQDWFTLSVP